VLADSIYRKRGFQPRSVKTTEDRISRSKGIGDGFLYSALLAGLQTLSCVAVDNRVLGASYLQETRKIPHLVHPLVVY
jgi:hypothetical protein